MAVVTTRILASALVGGILVGSVASAQSPSRSPVLPAARLASFSPGALAGYVVDERGDAVPNAVVSALGSTTTVVTTDDRGRFEFGTLAPGPYLLRVHLAGFVAPRASTIHVSPSARATTSIALRRVGAPVTLTAGVSGGTMEAADKADVDAEQPEAAATAEAPAKVESETSWRLRHARRGVLKEAAIPADWLVEVEEANDWSAGDMLDAIGSPARAATNFFIDTPFSGQINLLTSGSFNSAQQLLSVENLSNNSAYVRVGAPVGEQGDVSVRGAVSRADISSWIVAGAYATRAPARRRHDIGLSYATQRYDVANPLTRRDALDNAREAGAAYAYETLVVSSALALTYGAAYSRYDYLEQRNLFSPRFEITLTPTEGMRVSAAATRQALAPGAEEFLPPGDSGVWLPPQRTFSAIDGGTSFDAERSSHLEAAVERDFGKTTVAFRAFTQRTDDQLVTLFGGDLPGRSAALGHYLVGNVGTADAQGCRAAVRTLLAGRVHGSVEYTMATAQLRPGDDARLLMLVAPSTVRLGRESIHDVSTTIETEVPETATKVYVLYRVGNGFAQSAPGPNARQGAVDGRFDVQIRQSLPFMNFSTARFEMLIAVRNLFRESSTTQSIYDELLVVRPPKRVVGGVTLKF